MCLKKEGVIIFMLLFCERRMLLPALKHGILLSFCQIHPRKPTFSFYCHYYLPFTCKRRKLGFSLLRLFPRRLSCLPTGLGRSYNVEPEELRASVSRDIYKSGGERKEKKWRGTKDRDKKRGAGGRDVMWWS